MMMNPLNQEQDPLSDTIIFILLKLLAYNLLYLFKELEQA